MQVGIFPWESYIYMWHWKLRTQNCTQTYTSAPTKCTDSHNTFPDWAGWPLIITIASQQQHLFILWSVIKVWNMFPSQALSAFYLLLYVHSIGAIYKWLYFLTYSYLAKDFRETFSVLCRSMMRRPKLLKKTNSGLKVQTQMIQLSSRLKPMHARFATLQFKHCSCIAYM